MSTEKTVLTLASARGRWGDLTRTLTVIGSLVLVAGTLPSTARANPPGSPAAVPPSTGARPDPDRPLGLTSNTLPRPGNAPTLPATWGGSPVAADPAVVRIAQEATALETLAEQVNRANEALAARRAEREAAAAELRVASTMLELTRHQAKDYAVETYIDASGGPITLTRAPLTDLLDMTAENPIDALGYAVDQHDAAVRAAAVADAAALAQEGVAADLAGKLASRSAALESLRAKNLAALAPAGPVVSTAANPGTRSRLGEAGGRAGTSALTALQYAIGQLGKPYVWGDEGPDTFDCSGLVQAAYATADVWLPRTARPQYWASSVVPTSRLLPGDLLFFATDKSNWNTIHHVGIYLGNGMMIHAPTTGDVVKVAPIWWEEFFAATRVVPGQGGAARPSTIAPIPSGNAVATSTRPGGSRPSTRRPGNTAASPRTPTSPSPSRPAPPSVITPTLPAPPGAAPQVPVLPPVHAVPPGALPVAPPPGYAPAPVPVRPAPAAPPPAMVLRPVAPAPAAPPPVYTAPAPVAPPPAPRSCSATGQVLGTLNPILPAGC